MWQANFQKPCVASVSLSHRRLFHDVDYLRKGGWDASVGIGIPTEAVNIARTEHRKTSQTGKRDPE